MKRETRFARSADDASAGQKGVGLIAVYEIRAFETISQDAVMDKMAGVCHTLSSSPTGFDDPKPDFIHMGIGGRTFSGE